MPTAAKRKRKIIEVVPFLRVADMPASIRFYVDGLDARIAVRWEPEGELRWCRLKFGGSALMLQTFGPELRERASANGLGLGVSLAFQCADAVALYHDFRSRGVEASEPMVGNGLWNTSVTDPDGYVLEFASPTEIPEETRLSDVAGSPGGGKLRHYWRLGHSAAASREKRSSRHAADPASGS